MSIILNGKEINADIVITTIEPVLTVNQQLKGYKIAYDCGHGGVDVGAIGASGAYEKDYNRRIGDVIMPGILLNGATVIEARSDDTAIGLGERAQIANSAGADIFISGHHNANENTAARGIETYHFPGSVKGKALAEAIHKYVAPASGLYDRGVKEANFQVLRDTHMPAVLIEFGFITNAEEEKIIATDAFRDRIADAVIMGLEEYFGIT